MTRVTAAQYREMVRPGADPTKIPTTPAARKIRYETNKANERAAQIALTQQLAAHGIGEPIWEHRFDTERKWRFDGAYPEHLVGFEIEGGTRSQGRHTRHDGYEGDCEKYNAASLAGWKVLRFTYAMVRDGRACEAIVAALIRPGACRDVEGEMGEEKE